MKLIYIANSRIPTEKAHGIQIMKMCEAFAKLGHEVKLIVPKRATHLVEEAFAFYGMKPSFEIVYLPTVDLIQWSGWVPKVLAYLQNWTFRGSIKKYLKTNKPDLIHTRDELTALALPQICPIILEIHNISRILKNRASLLNSRITKFVVITKGLKDELTRLGYWPNKISIFPDGVDLELFKIQNSKLEIRKKLGLAQDKKIVIYTGHLYEWKGAKTLLQAARNFQFLISNFQTLFVFVGGTEGDVKKFKQQAQGLNNVLILGHKPPYAIPKYLAAADVLVLPNSAKSEISRVYTSPLKLFEYMAAERPIIASDLPSIREILDEETAVFAIPDNPQSFLEAISKVLKHPELYAKLSRNAFSKVQNFTWENRARGILERIKNL